jgi:predicted amidophosphoribosyltransferase
MSENLVPIATFVRATEANAAKFALAAEGIDCFLSDETLVGMYGIAANALGYIKLLVPAHHVERARRVLDTPFDDWPSFSSVGPRCCRQCGEELDDRLERCRHCGAPRLQAPPPAAGSQEEVRFVQSLQQAQRDEALRQADNPYAPPRTAEHEPELANEEDEAALDDRAGHERCAGCGRPRVAVCPFCKTNGSRFRPADMIDADQSDGAPHLLICPVCDEPFEPSYLRICEWCGHDAGEGIEAPEIVRPLQSEPVNWRVVLVGVAGAATVAGLVIYFARLLS